MFDPKLYQKLVGGEPRSLDYIQWAVNEAGGEYGEVETRESSFFDGKGLWLRITSYLPVYDPYDNWIGSPVEMIYVSRLLRTPTGEYILS